MQLKPRTTHIMKYTDDPLDDEITLLVDFFAIFLSMGYQRLTYAKNPHILVQSITIFKEHPIDDVYKPVFTA